jgi:hypothetical protein
LTAVWCHTCICSLLSFPLLLPSDSSSSFTGGQCRKKSIHLLCKIATNDYFQNSESQKCETPVLTNFQWFCQENCTHALDPIYYNVHCEKVAIFLRRSHCRLICNQEKEILESSLLFLHVFICLGLKILVSSLKYMKSHQESDIC